MIDGELDVSALGVTGNFDLEQKSEFGGFVGSQFDLSDSSSIFIEYQMTRCFGNCLRLCLAVLVDNGRYERSELLRFFL